MKYLLILIACITVFGCAHREIISIDPICTVTVEYGDSYPAWSRTLEGGENTRDSLGISVYESETNVWLFDQPCGPITTKFEIERGTKINVYFRLSSILCQDDNCIVMKRLTASGFNKALITSDTTIIITH